MRTSFKKGFIKDDKLALLIRGQGLTSAQIILEWIGDTSKNHTYTADSKTTITIEGITYEYWTFKFDKSYTYNELIDADKCLIKLSFSNSSAEFREIKLFKYAIGKDGKLIVPDLTKVE